MRLALALILALLAVPASAAADTRIVVSRDPGLSAAERADIRADAGVEHVRDLRLSNVELVVTDHPQAALRELERDPDVRWAELDHRRRAVSADPEYGLLWGLENTGTNLSSRYPVAPGTPDADMDVPDVWHQSTGAGVTVAVVDTGIDATHEDLTGHVSPLSKSFVVGVSSYADGNDHGTHVSGTIAATRDNGIGVVGVAPDARIMALKALDNGGAGWDSDIADAFDYAADHGARIVNASLGGPDGDGGVLRTAIARHPDTLYVVAAGNGGLDGIGDDVDVTPDWPCSLNEPNVLCVGASTETDGRASFSNFGATAVDVFAPGRYILSTVPGGYDFMSGTSMAAPHVAAEAALALAAAPSLSTAALKAAILDEGDDVPAFAAVSVSGRRANAAATVGSVAPASPPDDDADGLPNAADAAPRGVDADGDGVPALDDDCPAQAASTGNGCPAPVSTPAPPPPPADRDADGIVDAADACPAEAARTPNGCRVPAVRSLTVRVSRRTHKATARVRADRSATAAIRIERRSCRRRHCRWVRVATRTVATRDNAAVLVKRLARGTYRVSARLSSASGTAAPVRKTFRVR